MATKKAANRAQKPSPVTKEALDILARRTEEAMREDAKGGKRGPISEADEPTYGVDASGDSELKSAVADEWLRTSGVTPAEFLAMTMRNPFQRMSDRISAAKALMDYAHRKLPSKIEMESDVASREITLDAAAMTKLSDKELDTLMKLLEKVK